MNSFIVKPISTRRWVLVFGCLLASCVVSCGADEDLVLRKRVDALGGSVVTLSREDLRHHGFPEAYAGRIVGIKLNHLNLKAGALDRIIPGESLLSFESICSTLTDEHLKTVARCQDLRWANLVATDVTDAGIKDLSTIETLEMVVLNRCDITDEGLVALTSCKSLKQVAVRDTHVTDAGVRKLRKALPSIELVTWATVPSDESRKALVALERGGAFIGSSTRAMRHTGFIDRKSLVDEVRRRPVSFSVTFGGVTSEWTGTSGPALHLQQLSNAGALRVALRGNAPAVLQGFSKRLSLFELRFDPGPALDEPALQAITTLASVERIVFNSTTMGRSAFRLFGKVKGLRSLLLKDIEVPDNWTESLAKCRELKSLEVEFCDLKGKPFEVEEGFESLKSLSVVNCRGVDEESLAMFRQAHPDLDVTLK